MQVAASLPHPFAGQLPLHPLYQRTLDAQLLPVHVFTRLVHKRIAHWCQVAGVLEESRKPWLCSLPSHARARYAKTELHGPLLFAMHARLDERGYPDKMVVQDVAGFPSAGVLRRSGVWPAAKDCDERVSDIRPLADACAGARARCKRWARSRKPDEHHKALLDKYTAAKERGQCEEISQARLMDYDFALVHSCFVVSQEKKLRCIMDCTLGELNPCTASVEKFTLCSADDPLDYASRLLNLDPTSEPRIALADEEDAYGNWANSNPRLHIAMVTLPRTVRYFEDFVLSTGDIASVYAYGRIRMMLTVFCMYEFLAPVWAYFDDSMLVSRSALANVIWHAFLKLHAILRVPIQGNPLDPRVSSDPSKLRPPAGTNKELGELLPVAQLPVSRAATDSRLVNGRALINTCLKDRRVPPGLAASTVGKKQFLGGSQYGRVGYPGLSPFYARQMRMQIICRIPWKWACVGCWRFLTTWVRRNGFGAAPLLRLS